MVKEQAGSTYNATAFSSVGWFFHPFLKKNNDDPPKMRTFCGFVNTSLLTLLIFLNNPVFLSLFFLLRFIRLSSLHLETSLEL